MKLSAMVNKPDMWHKMVELIVQEIKSDPTAYNFSGGMTPTMLRAVILENKDLTVSMLKWFVATCEARGHNITGYARKTDNSGNQLRALCNAHSLKGKNVDGKYSVIATKVAISDIFIEYRKQMGPATFNNQEYDGSCPLQYQWLGSLSSMVMRTQEEDSAEDRLTACSMFIGWYESFSNWYINVRADAAKAQRPDKEPPSAEEILNSKNISRGYYFLALRSFSRETRLNWLNGIYNQRVEAGSGEIDGGTIDIILKKKYPEYARTARGTRVPRPPKKS